MQTYRPRRAPRGLTVDQLGEWVSQELEAIHRAAQSAGDFVPARALNTAPVRPKTGYYFADGTNWNPGSGKGRYFYDESTGAYTFLG